MVLTPSTMLPLGTKAPDFSLPNVDGKTVSLASLEGAKAYLIVFMCNHCPYVIHVAPELAKLAAEYQKQGVAVVGINSNDAAGYPADSPEQMVAEAKSRGYTFPYLFDETQDVAKAYHAACTPDFYVFDKDLQAGLSRTVGLQPPGLRRAAERERSAGSARRGVGRPAGCGRPEAQHRLQHQMEERRRAGLLLVACRGGRRETSAAHFSGVSSAGGVPARSALAEPVAPEHVVQHHERRNRGDRGHDEQTGPAGQGDDPHHHEHQRHGHQQNRHQRTAGLACRWRFGRESGGVRWPLGMGSISFPRTRAR